MFFSHSLACAVLTGLFAGLMGWFARQLMAEREAADTRAKLDDAARAREALNDRYETAAKSLAALTKRYDDVRAAGMRSATHAKSLEAELERHEGHIVELAQIIAERDRVVQRLEEALAALTRRQLERPAAAEIALDYESNRETPRPPRDSRRPEAPRSPLPSPPPSATRSPVPATRSPVPATRSPSPAPTLPTTPVPRSPFPRG